MDTTGNKATWSQKVGGTVDGVRMEMDMDGKGGTKVDQI
jgi:hypothetical protein